jgi:hypothetical protein
MAMAKTPSLNASRRPLRTPGRRFGSGSLVVTDTSLSGRDGVLGRSDLLSSPSANGDYDRALTPAHPVSAPSEAKSRGSSSAWADSRRMLSHLT